MAREPRRIGRRAWAFIAAVAVLTAAAVVIVTAEHSREARERRELAAEARQRPRREAQRRRGEVESIERLRRQEAAEARGRRREAAEAKVRERRREEPLERWRTLERGLVPLLALDGGVKAYVRINEQAEDASERARVAAQIKTLASSIAEEGNQLQPLAMHSTAACATAIQNARTLLARWQETVEQTTPDSMASEYAWANAQHELEPLESPPGYLGDGLQVCDPSGTGEVEAESES